MDRFLSRFGESVWIGAIALAASLGVVTALASFGAAAAALRHGQEGPGVTAAWWSEFRGRLPGSLALSAAVAALAVVAAADVAFAVNVADGALRYLVFAVGGALSVGLLAVVPFLAALEPHAGTRDLLRSALALAGIRPHLTLVLVAAGLAVLLASILLPPLAPVYLAAHLALTNSLYRHTRSALRDAVAAR